MINYTNPCQCTLYCPRGKANPLLWRTVYSRTRGISHSHTSANELLTKTKGKACAYKWKALSFVDGYHCLLLRMNIVMDNVDVIAICAAAVSITALILYLKCKRPRQISVEVRQFDICTCTQSAPKELFVGSWNPTEPHWTRVQVVAVCMRMYKLHTCMYIIWFELKERSSLFFIL